MKLLEKLSLTVLCLLLISGVPARLPGESFKSNWQPDIERPWIGADYWSNPLPDWRLRNGRAECWRSGSDRNVYLLTAELTESGTGFVMEVITGALEPGGEPLSEGWVGFKVGSRGEFNDYRDTAIRGFGLAAGVTTDGKVFIGDPARGKMFSGWPLDEMRLRLEWNSGGGSLTLAVFDKAGKPESQITRTDINPGWLTGSGALVCSSALPYQMDWTAEPPKLGEMNPPYLANQSSGGNVHFWFRDWSLSGDKVALHQDRAYGPILFTCYTLSNRILKLTAHLAPVGNGSRVVYLQVKDTGGGAWKTVGEELLDPLARTATFRVSGWDDSRDAACRVAYYGRDGDPGMDACYFEGTVRHNPLDKKEIVVAAFTGNNDFGFPHADVVRHVRVHQPDLLAYTGDQIYEATGGYSTLRVQDVNLATLDYLRRWYMFGWEYRDLLREIPSVELPDDHDMFQGNIWGASGRVPDLSNGYAAGQDRGGYCMPPLWVDMVQRTQTSHFPDPYDSTPVDQGIGVYYTALNWGGVSFAVIEDRKWKSSPTTSVPKGDIVNGWSHNPDYDAARDGDMPGEVLLGDRQLAFLDRWTADWSGGAWMKVVISQTLFANVCTLPPPARADEVVPTLKILPVGEYAQGDVLVQDHDSDGWPQTGRRLAVEALRRGFAFHISGDQHLGSTVQYGVDDWRDASWAVCVPSVANVWPRRWFPPYPGRNPVPGLPPYTGNYLDGFGNRVTVYAVSNPHLHEVKPAWINDRAPGYGIIKFDRDTRKISVANWPRWVDPAAPEAKPYPGWPVTFDQTDNYGREAAGWLPELVVSGLEDPVVQVIEEAGGKVVYTLRIKGRRFSPKVFAPGSYTVRVGGQGDGDVKVFDGLKPQPAGKAGKLEVVF